MLLIMYFQQPSLWNNAVIVLTGGKIFFLIPDFDPFPRGTPADPWGDNDPNQNPDDQTGADDR